MTVDELIESLEQLHRDGKGGMLVKHMVQQWDFSTMEEIGGIEEHGAGGYYSKESFIELT